jgi:hypothetical protein
LVGIGPSGSGRRDMPELLLARKLHVAFPERGHQTTGYCCWLKNRGFLIQEVRFARDSPLEERPVSSEPVSEARASECDYWLGIQHQIQWFASQLPTHRNREFIWG